MKKNSIKQRDLLEIYIDGASRLFFIYNIFIK